MPASLCCLTQQHSLEHQQHQLFLVMRLNGLLAELMLAWPRLGRSIPRLQICVNQQLQGLLPSHLSSSLSTSLRALEPVCSSERHCLTKTHRQAMPLTYSQVRSSLHSTRSCQMRMPSALLRCLRC